MEPRQSAVLIFAGTETPAPPQHTGA